jgi:hypothetical protein
VANNELTILHQCINNHAAMHFIETHNFYLLMVSLIAQKSFNANFN